MFPDYTSLVLQAYYQKRAANNISPRLINPTPAKLKEESVAVCMERFVRKDVITLRAFFGQSDDARGFVQLMKRCETDRFKPLVNFLKQKTSTTEDKNVELLAWLIDFEPRPFVYNKMYDSNTSELSVDSEQDDKMNLERENNILALNKESNEEVYTDHQTISRWPITSFKTKVVSGAVAILLLLCGYLYWKWNNNLVNAGLTDERQCMYWVGDHYQAVSCNQKFGDTLVVAVDSAKLYHFKRITTPDTITENSKGRIWYIKIKGNLEFYTAGGYHPIDPKLRLRPISDYIFVKYILPMREVK